MCTQQETAKIRFSRKEGIWFTFVPNSHFRITGATVGEVLEQLLDYGYNAIVID